MTQIMVEAGLISQLEKLDGPVEIVDKAGRAVGHFVPSFTFLPEDNCPYSPEELAVMRTAQGGSSLAEIWKSLGVK